MRRSISVLAAALTLAGCASVGPFETPDFTAADKLNLNGPQPASGISTKLSDDDKAEISLMHVRASVNCLRWKNHQGDLFGVLNVGWSDNVLIIAGVPAVLAAAKVATGPLGVLSAVIAASSPTVAKLAGLPAPPTDAQVQGGLDFQYTVMTNAPGVARGLNDPAQRAATWKLIRVGFQQACAAAGAMPTTSVYAPKAPSTPASAPSP